MSQFQSICRYLVAAGSADAADGRSTYFLYTEDSSLISKEWDGKVFVDQTIIAESVRPNSAAAYILTSSVTLIIYIDTSSKLRAILFDDDCDEWYEDGSINIGHEVHPTGSVAACLNEQDQTIVLFQSKRSRLTVFNLNTQHITEIKVHVLTASPLWASLVNGTLYAFYISADDQCMHYTVNANDKWTDKKWSLHPFEGMVKQFIVEPKKQQRGHAPEFEAYVLTKEGALLHVAVDGRCEKLGRVDEKGNFVSERSVDLCCIEAQKDELTEEKLQEFLAADPSIIDAVGGPLSVTPLATACWSGNFDAVCLLLDNPYRLADPNALSPQNRTPLYYAVSRSPATNRKKIVSALLDAGARIDDCYDEDDFNTPLMNAVADTGDKDLIHELVDRGASLTKKNKRGQTAVMLAEGTGMELELQPLKERQLREAGPHSIQKEVIDVLVAIAMLVMAYFNNDFVKDIVGRVVTKLQEMNEEEVSDE